MLARRTHPSPPTRPRNNLTTPGPTAAAPLQSRRDHVSSSSPLTYHAYAPQCTHRRLRRRTSTLTHESTHNSHLQLRRQYRRARERPVGDPCASVGTLETSGVLRHDEPVLSGCFSFVCTSTPLRYHITHTHTTHSTRRGIEYRSHSHGTTAHVCLTRVVGGAEYLEEASCVYTLQTHC